VSAQLLQQQTETPTNPFEPITPQESGNYTAPLEGYDSGGGMLDAALGDLVASLGGEALFAVLLVGLLNLAYWLAGGRDLAVPAVFSILTGFIAFPMLPGQYIGLARAIIVLGGASMLLELARRYVLDPGAR
jgi:hypothetical protein